MTGPVPLTPSPRRPIIAAVLGAAALREDGTIVAAGAGTGDHGAARIVDHPLLDALPPARIVTFSFDGAPVEGREGEPIAVALLSAGRRILRTMPRFDDARGGYCMIGRCADCLVVVAGVTNVFSCLTPVSEGLEVRSQHGLGSADLPESHVASS